MMMFVAADQPVAILAIGAVTAFLVGVAGVITALVQLRKAKTDLISQQQAHDVAMATLKNDLEAGRIADRRATKDDTTAIIDRLRTELDRAWTRIDTLEEEITEWRGKCEECLLKVSELERR